MAIIKADHKKYAHTIFAHYLNFILKQSFSSVRILGDFFQAEPNKPLLVLANHSTWWDGFFIYHLNRLYWKKRYHVMMLEEQLLKYPFFRKVGAFSIKQDNTKNIISSLNYAAGLLENSDNLINIFPQGVLLPHYKRPLEFAKGTDYLMRSTASDAHIILVAIRIEYLKEKKPYVFIKTGSIDGKMFFIEKAEEIMTQLLDEIDSELLSQNIGKEIYPTIKNL